MIRSPKDPAGMWSVSGKLGRGREMQSSKEDVETVDVAETWNRRGEKNDPKVTERDVHPLKTGNSGPRDRNDWNGR